MVILIAEQDFSTRRCLHLLLKRAHDVILCVDHGSALQHLEETSVDLVLVSEDLPGIASDDFISRGKQISPQTSFLLMTNTGTAREGVPSFSKPFDVSEVEEYLRGIEEFRSGKMTAELAPRFSLAKHLIGKSLAMSEARRFIKAAAMAESPVLISGPPGTGKRHMARLIHDSGPRAIYPFITVDCANVDVEHLEAELFGYERGAFRGAATPKAGKLEFARGGTLLLEEVAGLSLKSQAKLLMVLRERCFQRLGGERQIRTNARIISETNVPLKNLVQVGKFDPDLYAQLNFLVYDTPSLSSHIEDVSPLIQYFCEKLKHDFKIDLQLSPEAVGILERYSYPGNTKELHNILEHLAEAHPDGALITPELLPADLRLMEFSDSSNNEGLEEKMNAYELELILSALEKNGGDERKAAAILKIRHEMLVQKLGKFGLHSNEAFGPKKVA